MAKVPLFPIGKRREEALDHALYRAQRETNETRERAVEERRRAIERGWGDRYIERVHAKGKKTARERVLALCDRGSPLYEVGTFVNANERFGELESPAAGVVTTFGRVEGRWCMVIANDNTVASGAWWPRTPEKIHRAQSMALRLRLPVVYLVDCSGLFLPEQARSFAGARGAGHIFKLNSELSAAGVPQIAGVLGDSIAGGGYMPIISDRVYMTDQAYMVIAGAALVRGAKSETITSLDIGGPEVHVHESRCADVRVPDDDALLVAVRAEIARLPTSGADFYRAGVGAMPPRFASDDLVGLLPADPRHAYAIEEVIARLVDQSLFWECMPERGLEVVTGVGRIGGLYAGLIANRQGLIESERSVPSARPAGILYAEGIAKISAFVRACDSDGLPIVWLQDIGGFDIGEEAERHGLLASGSNLIYGNSTVTTPMFTILLRKASGAGYYAMAGLPYDPIVQLSTCISRLGVMEGRTLAIATYRTKLDSEFRIATDDPDERARIEAAMREVEARIEADMDPMRAASSCDTDEIVPLGSLRAWLEALIEMSYQATGFRRIKNPRIWSLHDVATLSGGTLSSSHTNTIEAVPSSATAQDGPVVLRSPRVGLWQSYVRRGDLVGPNTMLGILEILGRAHPVRASVEGRVLECLGPSAQPVGYDTTLLTLEALGVSTEGVGAATFDDDHSDIDGEALFVRAPRSGRFYLRAAPNDEPFVTVGAVLAAGDTIGLIEVMKTYSRLTYEPTRDRAARGIALPDRCRVDAILAGDGMDVAEGQPLLRVSALGSTSMDCADSEERASSGR